MEEYGRALEFPVVTGNRRDIPMWPLRPIRLPFDPVTSVAIWMPPLLLEYAACQAVAAFLRGVSTLVPARSEPQPKPIKRPRKRRKAR